MSTGLDVTDENDWCLPGDGRVGTSERRIGGGGGGSHWGGEIGASDQTLGEKVGATSATEVSVTSGGGGLVASERRLRPASG